MARKRDRTGEYARRMESARRRGITGAAAYGHSKRAAEAAARKAQRAAERAARPKPRKRPKPPPLKRRLGRDGEVTVTRSGAELMRTLKAAAAAGLFVTVTVTFDLGDEDYRTGTSGGNDLVKYLRGKRIEVDAEPGEGRRRRPTNKAGRFLDGGTRPSGPAPGGKARILVGPRSLAAEMEPAAGLAADLGLYVNPWDGLYDILTTGDTAIPDDDTGDDLGPYDPGEDF